MYFLFYLIDGNGNGNGSYYTGMSSDQWRSEGGGVGGGHGPRAQALEGAPAQLVGANFKKKA